MLLYFREYPPMVFVVSRLIPDALRMLLYALIASLAFGAEGMRFAIVGAGLLCIATTTVAQVTDLPINDAMEQTYTRLALGRLPVVFAYLARSAALALEAVIISLCVMVALPLVTGQADLVLPMLTHYWLVLPVIFSSLGFGLTLVAPSVTSPWSMLTYNTATAVVTVLSGAVMALPDIAGVATVSRLIPFTHGVEAMRLALAGQPYGHAVLAELAVGAGWWIAAFCAYALVERRGRSAGVGAFGA
jgi:ABC-type uncharacterized transport system permease subunit